MLKRIVQRVCQKTRAVRETILGEVVKDFGKVWTSPNGKRAFYASVHQVGRECAISLGYGHPKQNPATWLYPVSEGCRIVGSYSERLRELSLAAERCSNGESIQPSGDSKGTTINRVMFHRGLSDLRLVYSQRRRTNEIRCFCAQKKGQPILLVIEDQWSDPDDSLAEKVIDVIEGYDGRGSSQSGYQWPIEGFTAAVDALRDSEAEVLKKLL